MSRKWAANVRPTCPNCSVIEARDVDPRTMTDSKGGFDDTWVELCGEHYVDLLCGRVAKVQAALKPVEAT